MHQQVDALRHGHTAVQKFLRSHGGQLLGMEVSVELCNAAAVGDVARMKSLIENGANPNAGDYDDRTGPFPSFLAHPRNLQHIFKCYLYSVDVIRCKSLLQILTRKCLHARANMQPALHLAASNGETSALDYLLRQLSGVQININPLDRLGGISHVIFTTSLSLHLSNSHMRPPRMSDGGGIGHPHFFVPTISLMLKPRPPQKITPYLFRKREEKLVKKVR